MTHPLFYRKAPTFSSQGFVTSKIFFVPLGQVFET